MEALVLEVNSYEVSRKLYMVPCHSFYIVYETWRRGEVGGAREVLQSSYVEGKPRRTGK